MKTVKVNAITIEEGMYYRKESFSANANLITSEGKNSTGKTTFLRFLLYGLGYQIPSTKGINFGKCNVTVNLTVNNKEVIVNRNHNSISINKSDVENFYSLPLDVRKVHKEIFGEFNDNVIDNLLGTFYIDQDKGWTLLNRGVVISDIRFNIERFIQGLANQDISDLEYKLSYVEKKLSKYKQMLSVGEYQEEMFKNSQELVPENFDDDVELKLINLSAKKTKLKKELKSVEDIINKNTKFKNFIEEMNLIVSTDEGEIIPVTQKNLVGFTDNDDIHRARAKMIAKQLAKVEDKIFELQKLKSSEEQENKNDQLNLFGDYDDKSILEDFNHNILRLPVNTNKVRRILKDLDKERLDISKEIRKKTQENIEIIKDLNNNINYYAKEFGVVSKLDNSGVFTSALKKYSGAIYHKLVLAYRLAYIKAVEKHIGLNLPIIIDSPTGRELDQTNIAITLKTLKNDFSDHQIVIATISTLDEFEDAKEIIIQNKVISELKE